PTRRSSDLESLLVFVILRSTMRNGRNHGRRAILHSVKKFGVGEYEQLVGEDSAKHPVPGFLLGHEQVHEIVGALAGLVAYRISGVGKLLLAGLARLRAVVL